jgi:hypothetical protein
MPVKKLSIDEEIAQFQGLKSRLRQIWSELQTDHDYEHTSVIVPSLSVNQEELAKVLGASYYEERRLALGTTAAGRVVLALTRFDALGPSLGRIPFGFTSAEMATVMRALGCRDAILLDGGISGQLMVRGAGGAGRTWAGIRSVPLVLVAVSGRGGR